MSPYIFLTVPVSFFIEYFSHMGIDLLKTRYRLRHAEIFTQRRNVLLLHLVDQVFHIIFLVACSAVGVAI